MIRLLTIMSVLLLAMPVAAQDVVAPDVEDLKKFDQALAESASGDTENAADDSFGAFVSEEAKKLKDASVEDRKAFGQRIRSEVRKDGEHRPEAGRSESAGDARESVRENLPEEVRNRIGSGEGSGSNGRGRNGERGN